VPTVLWLGLVYAPLGVLLAKALAGSSAAAPGGDIPFLVARSAALACVIAGLAVVIGYVPARLLAGPTRHRNLVLLAILVPLILPDYVLYYAWSLLLSPTTYLGAIISSNQSLARVTSVVSSLTVLVLWHWPIAALIIGQAMRSVDPCILESAAIDAGSRRAFAYVTLPLLRRLLLLAFGVCFVLAMSSFTTFHLSGARTIGTELAVLYEQTFSPAVVARAAWPMIVPAALVAVAMGAKSRWLHGFTPPQSDTFMRASVWHWTAMVVLVILSVGIPVALLIVSIDTVRPFMEFLSLHLDQLIWGFIVAWCTAIIACITAAGVLHVVGVFRSRMAGTILYGIVFLSMFIPGSLVAVSLLELASLDFMPDWFRQSFLIVSLGQAARLTGLVLILFLLGHGLRHERLVEAAGVDGASPVKRFLHVHLPASWQLFLCAFMLVVMFSIAEIPATMILLPAGLPSYSQLLLNQMHYARDQQVIASCLVLMAAFVAMAAVLVFVLRRFFARAAVTALLLLGICVTGCDRGTPTALPDVYAVFGTTGRGQCQFMYPRAIDIAADGTVFIVDKAGRVQHLDADGNYLGDFSMPQTEAGKPTGITVGPDGNLYIADTHYHRVMVFSPDGRLISEFGRLGEGPGCFIYPTDVAFSGDGRIFVSEYGGNDRISVFSEKHEFLYSFGSPGDEDGQFSRPAAMAVDMSRKLIYIADACNNRIGVFDFDGKIQRYIGRAGTGPGEMRYPYSVVLTEGGDIAVCEYGNNRIQIFDVSGRSIGVLGRAGRQKGELAYPWALAAGGEDRLFVVDSGNNRIQVWQL